MSNSKSSPQKLEDNEILTRLAQDFHELVSDKETLRTSVENFLNNVVDELTLGIIFDLHRKYKTNSYDVDMEEDDGEEEENPEPDIFAAHDLKKTQECVCPNCDRAVAATRFAPHLEACMGMGRSRSRNATRRVASNSTSKDRENSSFGGVPSDDEDDIDWNSGNKRGKKKKRNGNKKSKGTPKKATDSGRSNDLANAEPEAEEEDMVNLRDLLQDHSNSSSPADSASSNQSTSSKKKDKPKIKKNKRDRSSPSANISAE